MFAARRTCCICEIPGKHVQIHHIDGDRSNNRSSNLAIICLDCHSKVTATGGLGRSFSPGEVRQYKRAWEHKVQKERGVHRPQIKYKKQLISQVDMVVCELLALRRNSPRAKELLDLLFELHLWRGSRLIDLAIIEGLQHAAMMTGLSNPGLAGSIATALWQMSFQFVGPDDVAMNKKQEKQVRDCISGLETLAIFNCQHGHGRRAINEIAETAVNFFEVSLWYSRKRLANAVLRVYSAAIESCAANGNAEFTFGRTVLRRSLRNVQKLLLELHPTWKHQRERVRTLIGS